METQQTKRIDFSSPFQKNTHTQTHTSMKATGCLFFRVDCFLETKLEAKKEAKKEHQTNFLGGFKGKPKRNTLVGVRRGSRWKPARALAHGRVWIPSPIFSGQKPAIVTHTAGFWIPSLVFLAVGQKHAPKYMLGDFAFS